MTGGSPGAGVEQRDLPTRGGGAPALIVALLVGLVLAVAGCGGSGTPASTTPGSSGTSAGGPRTQPMTVEQALKQPDGAVVLVEGYLFMSEGTFRLCSAVRESYPPQCGGAVLPVTGLESGGAVGLTAAGGTGVLADVAWSDYQYLLRGTMRAGTLDVTQPPVVSQTCQIGSADEPRGAVRVRVSHTPAAVLTGGRVLWVFDLTNETTAPVTMTFGSGQRGEIVLRGSDGVDVYRWSEGRAFTQAVEELVIEPGSSLGFALVEENFGIAPGRYDCVATLMASGVELPELELSVTVE